MFPSLHHVLFVLLPVALAMRMVLKPRPATLDVAKGVMHFCLGFGKWVLLVDPLWHLASVISIGGPESLSTSLAWMGFLARLLALHFALTSLEDVITGLGGMFGFKLSDKVQEILTLRRFTKGKFLRHLAILVVLALASGEVWLHPTSFFVSAPRTVATVFQQARVWTDFHVLTMFAALACFIGLPCSRDFLRVPAPWKAVICLFTFLLAVAMLWTHAAPMS